MAVQKICDNFLALMGEQISSTELSIEAGKHGKAFSKTCTEVEDMRLCTFLRYFTALKHLKPSKNISYADVLDPEVEMLIRLSAETDESIPLKEEFLIGLEAYVAILHRKNQITKEEWQAFQILRQHGGINV